VRPLNIYGHSKALAERRIFKADPKALIIRSSSFFGPWDEANFAHQVVQSLHTKESFVAADDIYISPTYVPELVEMSLDLLLDEVQGIWHLANRGILSWADFAAEVAERAGFSGNLISRKSASELGFKATRPKFSVIVSERGANLGKLEEALDQYFIHTSVENQIH
jgi:dTDP-4-dehydrorhamnose reductase